MPNHSRLVLCLLLGTMLALYGTIALALAICAAVQGGGAERFTLARRCVYLGCGLTLLWSVHAGLVF